MSPPVVRVNTFIECDRKPLVDFTSKIFIVTELVFGVYRIPIIGDFRRSYVLLALSYIFMINCVVIIVMIQNICLVSFDSLIFFDSLKFVFCNLLNFLLRNRLHKFYKELHKFDDEIGYEVKFSRNAIQNLIHMGLSFALCFALIFATTPNGMPNFYLTMLKMLPIKTFYAFELHYYGHLIGLISPRIRMLIHYMEVPYQPMKNDDANFYLDEDLQSFKKRMQKLSRIEMNILMDLYYNIIKAYDFLNGAIKWQMLILLTVSFIVSLGFSYTISTSMITGNFLIGQMLVLIGIALLELLPILAVCLFGDQVCKEAQQLRERLCCCLYDNVLDKPSRTAANAFMALIEARDLSFSLFHMFTIDITLPFKYLGLLLTYLIILLQFDKVINPKTNS